MRRYVMPDTFKISTVAGKDTLRCFLTEILCSLCIFNADTLLIPFISISYFDYFRKCR